MKRTISEPAGAGLAARIGAGREDRSFAPGRQTWFRRVSHIAALVALSGLVMAVAGSILQTLFNVYELKQLGVGVSLLTLGGMVGHDLVSFMPFYFLLSATAALAAFPVAAALSQLLPPLRVPLFLSAGVVGMACAFKVADFISPLPTLIAATRTVPGFILMSLTGASGGAVYAGLVRAPFSGRRIPTAFYVATTAVILLGVGVYFYFSLYDSTPREKLASVDYRVETLVDGLSHPWSLAFLPDGRMLVSERRGRLLTVLPGDEAGPREVEGLPDILHGGQGGLMDLLVYPRGESAPWVFFTYACGSREANFTCLERAELNDQRLENSKRLLQATPLNNKGTQYGSRLALLPDDTLLMSVGDAFDLRQEAQHLGNDAGKILRLNLDGSVPPDNPFVNTPGAAPEIFSYGHRNPQGLVYDARRDLVFEHENGPRGGDEVNLLQAGADYGWPKTIAGKNYPGDLITPYTGLEGVEAPIYLWLPSVAPSGMAVYYGDEFPAFEGDLLVTTLKGRAMYRLELGEDHSVKEAQRLLTELDKRLRYVTVAQDGSLYVLTDHDPGQILRVTAGRRSG